MTELSDADRVLLGRVLDRRPGYTLEVLLAAPASVLTI